MKTASLSLIIILTGIALKADSGNWLNIANLGNKSAYNKIEAEDGISGDLPTGWKDNSAWSGAQVTYSFQQENNHRFWRVKAEKNDGMAQFYFADIPVLNEKKYFILHLNARSCNSKDFIIGLRASSDPHNYYCSAKIALSDQWKNYAIPLTGGPATVKPVLFAEFFSPGEVDMATIRLEVIPADQYVPLTAIAKPGIEPNWAARHRQLSEQAAKLQPAVIIMGDSITQRWEDNGTTAWSKHLKPLNVANFGIDGDRVENLLWRIRDCGIGTRFSPRVIALLIGINT